MKKLAVLFALVPTLVHAGIDVNYSLRGKIYEIREKSGGCEIKIDSSEHPQYNQTYHYIENAGTCSDARVAHRLHEPVTAAAIGGGGGNRRVQSLEFARDEKPYWPPYGRSRP